MALLYLVAASLAPPVRTGLLAHLGSEMLDVDRFNVMRGCLLALAEKEEPSEVSTLE